MDPTVLRGVAERLGAQAEHLNGSMSDVQRCVDDAISHWDGEDAHSFNSWWTTHYRPGIAAAQQSLAQMAGALERNIAEQEHASGGAAGTGSPAHHASPPTSHPAATVPTVKDTISGPRDWHEVQTEYDAWATGRFASGGESYYQCTAWANYRWHELGYTGPAISGNGGAMAGNAGSTTYQPSLHAMASYGSGITPDYGHVMIVEEIRSDGAIRVSEMNADGRDLAGHPDEYRDSRWILPGADGNYYSNGGQIINFAGFPG
jgi:surface antigen/uncharacterized protein YukE